MSDQVTHGKERVQAPLLSIASSPHVNAPDSVKKIMWTVIITLIPAGLWGIYVFGLRALWQILIAGAVAMLTEYAIQKFRKVEVTCGDGSAFLTALLLVYCIPVSLPFWMTILGVVFAIGVVKQAFGGLGQNIFNPAHAGRAFLVASFPVQMTNWVLPFNAVVTGATPLGMLKEHGWDALVAQFGSTSNLYYSLFFGLRGGSIGEVSTLLLLIGGAVLIFKRYIYWQTPITYIATVFIFTLLLGDNPLFHIMSGGLIIGAFFMLTDMVTSPITIKGQAIFAVGAGVLVVLIRKFGAYPEGVCYSILLMNCVTPIIDMFIKPKGFKKV